MRMQQYDLPIGELRAVQKVLENSRGNLAILQGRKAACGAAADIPANLLESERHWQAEILRREAEIARLEAEIDQQLTERVHALEGRSLQALAQQRANAAEYLRDVQIQISEYPLIEEVPPLLHTLEQRLTAEIDQLEVAMQQKRPERPSPRATLTVEGWTVPLTEEEHRGVRFVLSRLLDVAPEQIRIVSSREG